MILTLGTFDLFHVGHLNFLQRASQLGYLKVGVNSDRFVYQYKGSLPAIPQDLRIEMVEWVMRKMTSDYEHQLAYLNDGPGRDLIKQFKPSLSLLVIAGWSEQDYLPQIGVTHDELQQWGIGVAYVPYDQRISTSKIKANIRGEIQ